MIVHIGQTEIACGLDWFKTPAGILALFIALPLALVNAWKIHKWEIEEEERRENGGY